MIQVSKTQVLFFLDKRTRKLSEHIWVCVLYIYSYFYIQCVLHSNEYEESATLDYFSAKDNEVCAMMDAKLEGRCDMT